jgi:serine/threonine protein kinase
LIAATAIDPILQVKYPAEVRITPDLHNLFDRILCKDPEQRITLAEIMQHPWVTEHGRQPLPSLRTLLTPPKMIEVR